MRIDELASITCSSPPIGTLEYFENIRLFIFKPNNAATFNED